jgi:hypothetical protein
MTQDRGFSGGLANDAPRCWIYRKSSTGLPRSTRDMDLYDKLMEMEGLTVIDKEKKNDLT